MQKSGAPSLLNAFYANVPKFAPDKGVPSSKDGAPRAPVVPPSLASQVPQVWILKKKMSSKGPMSSGKVTKSKSNNYKI